MWAVNHMNPNRMVHYINLMSFTILSFRINFLLSKFDLSQIIDVVSHFELPLKASDTFQYEMKIIGGMQRGDEFI